MNIKEFLLQKSWAIKLAKSAYEKRRIIEDAIMLQTPFLPNNSTIRQRAWHILNDINCVPLCPVCNNYLKFQTNNRYSKYCSIQCVAKSPETQQKRRETEIQKYGSIEAFKDYKSKILKRISLEKYGVENPFQADEIKNKIKKILKGS